MPTKKKIKANLKRNYTRKKSVNKLTLDNLQIDPYEEIVTEIKSKIGKRPKRPKKFPKGDWSPQALRVLSERYLVKNSKGKIIETPEDMCWRVSWEIASAEARWGAKRKDIKETAKEFYNLLTSRKFLPNSPTLMNAGTGNMLQYSACYVLPVEDSMEGIFDALKYQALIHKSGGGTGFAFSRLRSQGSMVKSSSGIASGPVSFMKIFDAATNEVKQGGKRRGANMGILRADHPDIMEFIHCKEEGGITNFNISVGITDEFMKAYEKGGDYDLIDPRNDKKVGKLNAKKVFDEIADGAWRTGDPGLIFLDRTNKSTANPVSSLGPVEATNPCGEQPLYPYDACNLGSIFLNQFVKEEEGKGGLPASRRVDWEELAKVAGYATRFLDNVIEVNPFPLPQISKTVHGIRRIGLGVGGWADMLISLGVSYDSEEALKLGSRVMKTIQDAAVSETQDMAKVRGPFPFWSQSIYKSGAPRRNSTVTTIAPTGTISIIANASSGIEPLFAIAYQHIVKDKHINRTLTFVNPQFEEAAKAAGVFTDEVKKKVEEKGILGGIDEIPTDLKKVYKTAHEIHHDWHIKTQAAFQKYTENAVSKTINMGNKVTVADIKKSYLLAWKTNCKGITVFRDGCKDAQVLNLGVNGEKKEVSDGAPLLRRPLMVKGATYKLDTPMGSAFITINESEISEPLEIFINVGKAGSDVAAMAEALGRTISASLRFKGELSPRERAEEIVHQLAGIGGRRAVGFGPNKIRSLPDAVAAALSKHYAFKFNGNGVNHILPNHETGAKSDLAGAVMSAQLSQPNGNGESRILRDSDHTMASAESYSASDGLDSNVDGTRQLSLSVAGDICPSCGASSLVYEEGCSKCYSCGHSEC